MLSIARHALRVGAEDEARKARRGLRKATFVEPWRWHATSPPRPAARPARVGPVVVSGR